MRYLATILVCVAAVATCAVAQATNSGNMRYMGQVTGTNVYVRSGPDTSAYHCAKVSSPMNVKVLGQINDWLRIVPPSTCHSLIRKDHVWANAQGTRAKVKTGGAYYCRTGGYPDAAGDYKLQRAMRAGEEVRIIGVEGDYYKIKPPKGATVWIAAEFVKRTGQALPEEPDEEPSGRATTKPATDDNESPATVTGVAAMKAVDKELQAEYKKPLAKRDYKAFLAKYEALLANAADDIKPYLADRIKLVKLEIETQRDAVNVAGLTDKDSDERRRADAALMRAGTTDHGPVANYAAKGILAASAVFANRPAIGTRYALLEAKAPRLIAYVLGADKKVNVAANVGKLVGVYGDVEFDRSLATHVIRVQKVVVLADEPKRLKIPVAVANAPAPAAPTPKAKPAPKPKVKTVPKAMPTPTTKPASKAKVKVKAAAAAKAKSTTKPAPKPKARPVPTAKKVKSKPAAKPTTMPAPKSEATESTATTAPTSGPAR